MNDQSGDPPTPATTPALLDRAAIRSPWSAACEGADDATPLPLDPRTLVVDGVNTNASAAIQFNAYYVDLHNPPAPFVNKLPPRPSTCGEFRASVARGREFIQRQPFQSLIAAPDYNNLWQRWGYAQRPSDFDEQVAKRYGLSPSPISNPYPLEAENPNETDGGSGQLPIGLMQGRGKDGRWTGEITLSCSMCHDARLGTETESEFHYGQGNGSLDLGLFASDITGSMGGAFPIAVSHGRGATSAIAALTDLVTMFYDMDTLEPSPSLTEAFLDGQASGFTKAPNWWNRAFRTRQFWDGALTSDNVRSEMAFFVASNTFTAAEKRAMSTDFEDVNNFLISLSPPAYPFEIDESLASEGAVLFHELDLWASGANADIPRQPGNGSCASCHGVYSPQYAEDASYLPDPRLIGVAGVVTPLETIDTDPTRYLLMKDERRRRSWNTSWWAYNDLSPDWTGYPEEDPVATETRRLLRADYANGGPRFSPEGPNEWVEPKGYVAPPLYGVWAASPYFHNGSVPDIWGVLEPSERPAVWMRLTSPNGQFGKNEGFDYSYGAYDFVRLGWKFTETQCNDEQWSDVFVPCSSELSADDQSYDVWTEMLADYFRFGIVTPPPIDDTQIRARLLFNTHLYGNDNRGHDFTRALNDDQRRAIIEYLKTL